MVHLSSFLPPYFKAWMGLRTLYKAVWQDCGWKQFAESLSLSDDAVRWHSCARELHRPGKHTVGGDSTRDWSRVPQPTIQSNKASNFCEHFMSRMKCVKTVLKGYHAKSKNKDWLIWDLDQGVANIRIFEYIRILFGTNIHSYHICVIFLMRIYSDIHSYCFFFYMNIFGYSFESFFYMNIFGYSFISFLIRIYSREKSNVCANRSKR